MPKQPVDRDIDAFAGLETPLPQRPNVGLAELTDEAFEHVKRSAITTSDQRISMRNDGTIQVGHLLLTPIGITQQGIPTEDDMKAAGQLLRGVSERSNILIGDWLVRAELVWGEGYKAAAEALGYDVTSLRNFKMTMAKIPVSMRSDKLTYNHYYIAATKLKTDADRVHWLGLAVQNGWSYRQLQDQVGGSTPPSNKTIDATVQFFSQTSRKYQQIAKKLSRAGDAQKSQIGILIDQQIEILTRLKRDILGKE